MNVETGVVSGSLTKPWVTSLACLLINFASEFTKSVLNKCLQSLIVAKRYKYQDISIQLVIEILGPVTS
jgi:hypothetical protein